MEVMQQGIVLANDEWAFLLAYAGVTKPWFLPLPHGADVERGREGLTRRGFLLQMDKAVCIDETLCVYAELLRSAKWALDIISEGGAVSLLGAKGCYAFVRPADARRTAVTPLGSRAEALALLDASLEEGSYQAGMRTEAGADWLYQMSREQLLAYLATLDEAPLAAAIEELQAHAEQQKGGEPDGEDHRGAESPFDGSNL